MDPGMLFWGAVGLLLVALGVESWHARREAKKRLRVGVPGRPPLQLTREPAPLEQPKVMGRIARREQS